MPGLSSFHDSPNVVVIGSSGGIGAALVTQLAEHSRGRVVALSRSGQSADKRVQSGTLDLGAEASIAAAAALASNSGPLDLVIVATGILHDGELQPEKSLREWDGDSMQQLMRVNAIGPALIAKHFLPLLRRDHKTAFAALSARVGSIADNRLGGWASYRASKSALNMLLKTAAVEHARRFPLSVVAALHPGTVDTALSKPFSSRVPQQQLFDPAVSAGHLLRVLDGLEAAQSGGFFAWDGQPIEF